MTGPALLRAVNLKDDLARPERLAHYQPTRRSLPLVDAILDGGAWMVIAPYGSGKSLCAGIGALFSCDPSSSASDLAPVLDRMQDVDPALFDRISDNGHRSSKGLPIVLTGHTPDVSNALASAAQLKSDNGDLAAVWGQLTGCSGGGGNRRLVVIWDEFGRHLEGLAAEGRSRDLHAVQQLAEWTERATDPPASLVLLMHQSLLAYAGSLNQTSRSEWKKIEGRFRSLRFLEDSQEIYGLAADFVADLRPHRPATNANGNQAVPSAVTERCVEERWFDGADAQRVSRLLDDCRPITAAALHTLPRVVARLGQNERSLFAFIQEADLGGKVGTTEVYHAFADAMRSDVGIGGTHRRWVETEDAIGRVTDELQREALTAACLLQLGVSGERKRLGRAALELAVQSRGADARSAAVTVDALIAHKLLLHRKSNDDISIWHSADIDLAARVRDERSRRESDFPLVAFLNEHRPAPIVCPTRHNADHGVARYFVGRYIDTSSLLSIPNLEELQEDDRWGSIYFVLADTAEDLARARKFVEKESAQAGLAVVFVLPGSPVPVADAALEVAALAALRQDEALLAEDPLVGRDLEELHSVAQRHLDLVLHSLVSDRLTSAVWIHGGKCLEVDPNRPASIALSGILDEMFHFTPAIANDQVMRDSPSRQIRTAQVRLILRIMEHGIRPDLGYAKDDTSAEASLYRTVLQRTGLHRTERANGRFADPEELVDRGLRNVWSKLQSYFTDPRGGSPKPLAEIVDELRNAPIGLPDGVMPILVMAGYRAFARIVSLRTDGEYVPDVLGFESRNMFAEPSRHSVTVHEADEETERYLADLIRVFSGSALRPHDELLRNACDALVEWKEGVPPAGWRSTRLGPKGRDLLYEIGRAEDLPDLLLESLPDRFGGGTADRYGATIKAIARAVRQVAGLTGTYRREAVEVISNVLSVRPGADAPEAIREWVGCFDLTQLLDRQELKSTDMAVLRYVGEARNGILSVDGLADRLSSILLQRRIDEWHDATVGQFRRQLKECRQRIEDAALESSQPHPTIAPLVMARIESLQGILDSVSQGGQQRKTASKGRSQA